MMPKDATCAARLGRCRLERALYPLGLVGGIPECGPLPRPRGTRVRILRPAFFCSLAVLSILRQPVLNGRPAPSRPSDVVLGLFCLEKAAPPPADGVASPRYGPPEGPSEKALGSCPALGGPDVPGNPVKPGSAMQRGRGRSRLHHVAARGGAPRFAPIDPQASPGL